MATCTHKKIDAEGDDLHAIPCDCENDYCDAKLTTCVGKCCDACEAQERGRCGTCKYDLCKPCFVRHLAECSSHTCAKCGKNPCEKTTRLLTGTDLVCDGCGRGVSAFKIAECDCHKLQYCYPCFNAHQEVMDKCECNGCGKNPCTCWNNDREHHGTKRKAGDEDDVDAKHKDANPRATKRTKVEGQPSPTARLESLVMVAAAEFDLWRPKECIRCDRELDVKAALVLNKYCSITCATDDPEATDDDDDRRAKQDMSTTTIASLTTCVMATTTTTASLETEGSAPPEPGRTARMRECRSTLSLNLPVEVRSVWKIMDEYLEPCFAAPPTYVATVKDGEPKHKYQSPLHSWDTDIMMKYQWFDCREGEYGKVYKYPKSETAVPAITVPDTNCLWIIEDICEHKGFIFVVLSCIPSIKGKRSLVVSVHTQDGAYRYRIGVLDSVHARGGTPQDRICAMDFQDDYRAVGGPYFRSYLTVHEDGDACTIRVHCWSAYFEHRFE